MKFLLSLILTLFYFHVISQTWCNTYDSLFIDNDVLKIINYQKDVQIKYYISEDDIYIDVDNIKKDEKYPPLFKYGYNDINSATEGDVMNKTFLFTEDDGTENYFFHIKGKLFGTIEKEDINTDIPNLCYLSTFNLTNDIELITSFNYDDVLAFKSIGHLQLIINGYLSKEVDPEGIAIPDIKEIEKRTVENNQSLNCYLPVKRDIDFSTLFLKKNEIYLKHKEKPIFYEYSEIDTESFTYVGRLNRRYNDEVIKEPYDQIKVSELKDSTSFLMSLKTHVFEIENRSYNKEVLHHYKEGSFELIFDRDSIHIESFGRNLVVFKPIKFDDKLIFIASDGYIIPTQDSIIFFFKGKRLRSKNLDQNIRNDNVNLKWLRRSQLKVSTLNGYYGVSDPYEFTWFIEPKYDSITFSNNFIIGHVEAEYVFYNNKLEKVVPVFDIKGVVQFDNFASIITSKNKVKFYGHHGFSDTLSMPPIPMCGSLPILGSTTYINQLDTSINIISRGKRIGGMNMETFEYDTIKTEKIEYTINQVPNEYFFYNGLKQIDHNKYISPGNLSKFNSFPFDGLVVKISGKWGEFQKNKYSQKNKCWEMEFSSFENCDEVKGIGIYQPLIFRNGEKWGYLGITDPNYKYLSKYKYGFSRFQKHNGRKGWVDYKGKEYQD